MPLNQTGHQATADHPFFPYKINKKAQDNTLQSKEIGKEGRNHSFKSSSSSLYSVLRPAVPSKSVNLAMISKEKAKLVKTQKMMKEFTLFLASPSEFTSLCRNGMSEKYSVVLQLQQKSMIWLISLLKSSTCLLSPSSPKMQTSPIPMQTREEMTMAILQRMVCHACQQILTISTLNIPMKARLVTQYRIMTTQSCQKMLNSDCRLYSSSVEQVAVKDTIWRAAYATSAASMQMRMLSTSRYSLNRSHKEVKQQLYPMKNRLTPPQSPITMQKYRKSSSLPKLFIWQFSLSIPRANSKGWNQKSSKLMKGTPAVHSTNSQQTRMLPVTRLMCGGVSSSLICGQSGYGEDGARSCLRKRLSCLGSSEQMVVISMVCGCGVNMSTIQQYNFISGSKSCYMWMGGIGYIASLHMISQAHF